VPIHLTSDSAGVVTNVTVLVVGGSVLPRLIPNGTTLTELSHVTVSISGARVGPYATSCSVNCSTTLPDSMSILSAASQRRLFVSTVSVVIENASVDLRLDVFGEPVLVGALMLSVYQQTAGVNVSSVLVAVRNSSIALAYSGTTLSVGLVHVFAPPDSFVDRIDMSVARGSSVTLVVNMTTGTLVSGGIELAVFQLRGALSVLPRVAISWVTLTCSDSVLSAEALALGTATASVVVSVLHVMYASNMTRIRVFTDGHSVVKASCTCWKYCRASSSTFRMPYLTARFVFFLGPVNDNYPTGNFSDVVVNSSKSTFHVTAPMSAAVARLSRLDAWDVQLLVELCNVFLTAEGQDTDNRESGVILTTLPTFLNTRIVVSNTNASLVTEHGGTQSVFEVIVGFDGAVDSSVLLTNVKLFATGFPTPVYSSNGLLVFSLSTCLCGVFSVAGSRQTPYHTGMHVRIVNSSIESSQNAPLASGTTGLYAVGLTLFALSYGYSTRNSSIELRNVHLLRLHPTNQSSASALSFITVSSLVMMADSRSFLFSVPGTKDLVKVLAARFPQVSVLFVEYRNVSVVVHLNCTVSYAYGLQTDDTHILSLLTLPDILSASSLAVNDSFPQQPFSGTAIFAIGNRSISSSNITVDCIGSAESLLVVQYGTLVITTPGTSFLFSQVQLASRGSAHHTYVTLHDFLFGADRGAIQFTVTHEAAPLDPSLGCVTITLCTCRGYTAVLMPNITAVARATVVPRINSSASAPPPALVSFGCNMWNDAPMPSTAIFSNGREAAILRPYVRYPPSSFNATTSCQGFDDSISHVTSEQLQALERATSAVTYASVFIGGGLSSHGTLSGLQRSSSALRLSARCLATSTGAVSNPPPFNSPLDNVLQLQLPVRSEELAYAAGAPLGNALLAVAVGLLLWLLLRAKRRVLAMAPQSAVAARVAAVVPYAALPGSIAGTYGMFLQPSIAACLTLLFASAGDARSAACGALLLTVWAAYPAYCVHAVLWRGRTGPPHGRRMFVLCGRKTAVHQRTASQSYSCRGAITAVLADAQRPVQVWAPQKRGILYGAPELAHARLLLSTMEPVFGGYVEGREWYFVVEWGVSVASGAVVGAAQVMALTGAAGASACAAADVAAWAAIAFTALHVALCVWLRPHSVRLELVTAVLFGCVELLANVLIAAGATDAAETAVTVSAITELVVVVLLAMASALRKWDAPAVKTTFLSPSIGSSVGIAAPQSSSVTVSQREQLQILVEFVCASRVPS
jgi:hypothetical protein